MKRVLAILVAVMICASMILPASATEFVPSIDYKDPVIVPVIDDEGKEAIGIIRDKNGNIVGYGYTDCLVVTPISRVKTSERIPDDAEEIILDVYADLRYGDMELPYDKVPGYDGRKMVIRDLIDATWLCGGDPVDHPEILSPDGVTLQLTFDLGIAPGVEVIVMTFNDGVWNPIVSATNNGDGTVTCIFEHLCPIAFSVGSSSYDGPAETGDQANVALWVALMAVSAVALAAVVVLFRRKAVK